MTRSSWSPVRTSAEDPWTDFCLQQADRILAVGSGGEPPPPERPPPGARRAAIWSAWDVAEGSGALSAWAEALDPIETHAVQSGERRCRHRAHRPPAGWPLARDRPLRRRRQGLLAHRRARGARGKRAGDRPRRRGEHGRLHRRDVRDGHDRGRDRRPLLRRVDPAPPPGRLHAAATFADPRRPRPGDAAEDLRGGLDRGAPRAASSAERPSSAAASSSSVAGASSGTRWARASRFPVLAPAQVRGRRILVDGSLVDNLPVAEMAALGEGPIIAVDVKASVERPPGASRQRPSERDGNGSEPELRTPSLGETLARVLLLGSSNTSASARRHADWIDHPPQRRASACSSSTSSTRRARREGPRRARRSRTPRRASSSDAYPLV